VNKNTGEQSGDIMTRVRTELAMIAIFAGLIVLALLGGAVFIGLVELARWIGS